MKNIILVSMMLALCAASIATATESAAVSQQAVVDRSTQSRALNEYALHTRDLIQKSWTSPLDVAVPGAVKGKVRINYTISKQGSVVAVKLMKSSGVPQMDRTLMQAIRSAAPFPSFPAEVKADSILIRANFIVADLPAVPVTRISHPVAGKRANEAASVNRPKQRKYRWGLPAGTARGKNIRTGPSMVESSPLVPPPLSPPSASGPVDTSEPPRIPPKKFKWGAQR